jgi:hypothetical protein
MNNDKNIIASKSMVNIDFTGEKHSLSPRIIEYKKIKSSDYDSES